MRQGDSFNRYKYGNNSPYSNVDPDGRNPVAIAIAGAVVLGVATVYQAWKAIKETREILQNRNSPYKNESNDESTKGGDTTPPIPGAEPEGKTGGGTRLWGKPGTVDDANKDFDDKNPSNVEDKGNGVRVGQTEDGKRIIVRPTSSDKRPTIEIQRPDGKHAEDKIRYGNKPEEK